MKRVGMIGLGIMGKPMAINILNAGYDLVVWNRSDDKCAPLTDLGATQASSPAEVVRMTDVTLAMVSDPDAAQELAFGEEGVVSAMEPGKNYIDLSTVDPSTPVEIGKAVEAAGGRFMEAPVSGSKKPAEEGTLILLAAGSRSLYDDALPILETLGKKVVFLGDTGNGAKMKLVVNMIMGSMMAAFGEGLSLAEAVGLDGEVLLDVLDNGAISNPMFRLKGPSMLEGNHPPAFPLKHMQKDMRLALKLGDYANKNLHVADAANRNFLEAKNEGYGDEDFSAVMKVLRGD